MKRYMQARHADDLCLVVNPEKPTAKCVMPIDHPGVHRSLTTFWEREEAA